MDNYSVVALFCDDIRSEASGQDTIVGVLPDNVAFTKYPAALPKLAVYVRIHLRTATPPKSISNKLVGPEGVVIIENTVEQHLITKTLADSQRDGAPHSGIISRFVLAPFPVTAPGRLQVITTIDGEEVVAGALNLKAPS